MNLPKEFYLSPSELFRVGNSTSPRMHMVRADEVDVMDMSGIKVIIANGRGVSLYTKEELAATALTGWIWRFLANTPLPQGLKLVNDKPGHFCVAPVAEHAGGPVQGLA